MADTAPEIKVVLTGEDRGVSAAIKELGNQLSTLKQKEQEVAESSFNLAGAFQALVASAVVLKLAEFGKEVFQTNLNIARLSEKIGVSAGMLSTFSKAAEGSGVSTEQVAIALGRLATNIVKFQQGGSQAAAAFRALNITQADFKNLSPDEKIRLVTDRLGKMHAGLQKAAIAQEIMGRGGQALIPTLDLLAGEGYDKVTAAAEATGQAMTADIAANTLAAAAAMNELAGAAKGAANQFEAGLDPAIIETGEALGEALRSNGADGFRSLGEVAGTVFRYIALGFLDIGTTVGGMVAVIREEFDQMWETIELGGETVANAIKSGSFKGAWDALVAGGKKAVAESKDDSGRMIAIFDQTGKQLAANYAALIPSAAEEAARQKARTAKFAPKAGPGDPPPNDDKANKARLSALEASLQEELALDKANNAAEESANQISYNEGLESLRDYFAKKKQLAQTDVDERVAILLKEKAATKAAPTDGTAAEEIAKAQKLAKFDSDIALAQIAGTQKQGELESEYFLAKEAHQKTVEGYQSEILKLQGQTYAAALAEIEGEAAAIKRNLVQAGLSPEAVAALMSQLQQLKLSSAAFDEDKKQGENALKALADAKADIELRVTAGLETQYTATRQIAQLELSRVATLEQIAATMKATAVSPEQVQAAEDFARHIREIQVAAKAASDQMQQFARQSGTAIEGDLNKFLTSTVFQAHTIGQAFRELAGSVVGSIQKIVTQLLLQIAMQKLLNAVTKQGGASGGGAGGIGSLAGIIGFDTGGVVPGVGDSDSVHAMLTPGEVVISKSAVQAWGLGTFAAINGGLRVPPIAGRAMPRFAEGGLVQGAGGGAGGKMDVTLGLDQGLVLKHLATKGAGRIVLQHLADNPKAATKAIGRGGK
jgi:hypothetical protein